MKALKLKAECPLFLLLALACTARTAPPADLSSTLRTVSGTWQAGDAASTWTASFDGDALTAIEEKRVQAGRGRSTATYAFDGGRLVRYAALEKRDDAQEVVTRVLYGPDGEPGEATRTVDGRDEPVDLEVARGFRVHGEALAALARGGGSPVGALLQGRFTWDAAGGPLPQGAIAAVRVEDVSQADAPGEIVAETTMPVGHRLPPVSFDLPYDRSRLQAGRRYGVRVRVEKDGRPLLASERPVPVFGAAVATAVEVTLVPVP